MKANDTISRQWLMECVDEGWIKFDTEKDKNKFIHLVRDIAPSAQPEPITVNIDHELTQDEYEKLRKDMANAPIMLLPSAQQWTSWESGELPKESGWYIVTAYDGRTSRTTFAKYQKRLKRWDLTGARAYWRVLAWRPLPEPAKIEG